MCVSDQLVIMMCLCVCIGSARDYDVFGRLNFKALPPKHECRVIDLGWNLLSLCGNRVFCTHKILKVRKTEVFWMLPRIDKSMKS